ncbi:MAG: hypothetical protein M1827_006269 [Pycnora praestabilis]|nr:MAG: hypothetical protein M1827_006269 [Pycnora praestabilis]
MEVFQRQVIDSEEICDDNSETATTTESHPLQIKELEYDKTENESEMQQSDAEAKCGFLTTLSEKEEPEWVYEESSKEVNEDNQIDNDAETSPSAM